VLSADAGVIQDAV